MSVRIRDIRKAKNASELPVKLRDSWLLGACDDTLFLASQVKKEKFELFEDIFVYGYSLEGDRISAGITIKGGGWPESWKQQNNILYLGTRWGNIVVIDMLTGNKTRQQKFDNLIDALAVNSYVFAGVNGSGVVRLDRELKSNPSFYALEEEVAHTIDGKRCYEKHLPVTSAITIFNNNVYLFHFSNGGDPFLGDSCCGGLVEVLDEGLKPVLERKLIPCGVRNAVADGENIYFATADTSNGWIPAGEGDLYSLNPKNLDYHHIQGDFAAIVSMARRDGETVLGLKDGVVFALRDNGSSKILHQQETPVNGILVKDKKIYVAKPGVIVEISK